MLYQNTIVLNNIYNLKKDRPKPTPFRGGTGSTCPNCNPVADKEKGLGFTDNITVEQRGDNKTIVLTVTKVSLLLGEMDSKTLFTRMKAFGY